MIAPDSPALVAILGGCTVVLLGVALWRWKGQRALTRIATLLGIQALLVGTVVAFFNTSEGLVTTWSGLVGSTSGMTPTVATDRSPSGEGANSVKEIADTSKVSTSVATSSKIESIQIPGAKTGYSLPAQIYLPGGYGASDRTYPVLQLLAGFPGSIQSWTGGLKLKETLDSLIGAGKLPPVIAVMPSQNTNPPKDSECVNATNPELKARGQAATYLGVDVPDYLKSKYKASTDRNKWVIGGYSTGGYCAAALALQYPQNFASVVELSGYDAPKIDNTTGKLFAKQGEREKLTVSHLLRQPHPHINFYLFTANDQLRDKLQMTRIADAVPSTDSLRVVTTPTGGHSPPLWQVGSRDAFTWLGPFLQ